MKTPRLLAASVVATAALLTLTGCLSLPAPGGTTTQTQAPAQGSGNQAVDLAGTTWTASDGANEMAFTLDADGTIDFSRWNDQGDFDVPQDTWEVSDDEITLTISTSTGNLVFTGTASTGSMSLVGSGEGEGTTLTMTEG